MKYNILSISDIHWDAMNADKLYNELNLIKEFIIEFNKLHLIVICGDYFDSKISLNSQSSIYAIQWMNELYDTCNERDIKLRVVLGTKSHDNNQLDAFLNLEEKGNTFKLFKELSKEETLPNLTCLYAPDEAINNKEYYSKYSSLLYQNLYDIMFFHGSFDVVVPEIVLQESEIENLHNVIFEYNHFSDISRLMIGGHWHDGDNHEHMFYTRSFSRWSYGEEKPKGCLFTSYDTENKSYMNYRIENIFADSFNTYTINTLNMKSMNDYIELIQTIDFQLQEYPNMHIRIKIIINNENIDNDNFINRLKQHYMNRGKRVKIIIKNDLIAKQKKIRNEKVETVKNQFSFISDNTVSITDKFQKFIKLTDDKEVPLEKINKYILKYINK